MTTELKKIKTEFELGDQQIKFKTPVLIKNEDKSNQYFLETRVSEDGSVEIRNEK
jgi:hypothetical protein